MFIARIQAADLTTRVVVCISFFRTLLLGAAVLLQYENELAGVFAGVCLISIVELLGLLRESDRDFRKSIVIFLSVEFGVLLLLPLLPLIHYAFVNLKSGQILTASEMMNIPYWIWSTYVDVYRESPELVACYLGVSIVTLILIVVVNARVSQYKKGSRL